MAEKIVRSAPVEATSNGVSRGSNTLSRFDLATHPANEEKSENKAEACVNKTKLQFLKGKRIN